MEPKAMYGDLNVADIQIDDGHNPRLDFEETALLDLGSSFTGDGQLMPVIVNQTGDEEYHMVAGERRLRAARAAGLKTIECKIYQDLDARTAVRFSAIENINRRNLNVIEEARQIVMLAEAGESTAQIATLLGVSEDTVQRRQRLLKLPEAIQHMMLREKFPLPIHQGLLLVGLDTDDAVEIARRAAPATGPVATEDQVRQWVDEAKNGPALPGVQPKQTKPSGGRVLSNVRHDPDRGDDGGFTEITDDGWPATDDEAPVREIDAKGRLVDPTRYKVPVAASVPISAEVDYGRFVNKDGVEMWTSGFFLRSPAAPCDQHPAAMDRAKFQNATEAIIYGLESLQDAVGKHQEAATSKTLKKQLGDVIEKIGKRMAFLRCESPESTVDDGRPTKELSPAVKKNLKSAAGLVSVKGAIGITGQIGVSEDTGQLCVGEALVTVNLDGQVHLAKVAMLTLDADAAATSDVINLLKKCQPKPETKPAKKKR